MSWVADYSWARPDPHALAGLGCVGVVRYLCYDGNTAHGKILFAPEVAQLRAAGLAVGVVWEVGEADAMGGAPVGHQHGTEANRQADMLNLPRDRPIYYAFDTDDRGQPGWQQLVGQYLDAARNTGTRPAGIYGSVRVVDEMVANGHAAYGWQTESWSNTIVSRRACLLQHPDPAGQYDRNAILRADWGQTPAPAPPTPPPVEDLEDEEMFIATSTTDVTHAWVIAGTKKVPVTDQTSRVNLRATLGAEVPLTPAQLAQFADA